MTDTGPLISSYVGAILIVAASVLAGRGIFALLGRPRGSAEPAVGFAAVMMVNGATLDLLHSRAISGLATVALLAGSIVAIATRARSQATVGTGEPAARRPWRRSSSNVVTAIGALALTGLLTLIPFLANARGGVLGQSVNNDIAHHLLITESLATNDGYTVVGYPIGPHGIVITLRTLTGIDFEWSFNSLLLASALLGALVACGGPLRDRGTTTRIVAASMIATPYLTASYFGQGSFKETILGVLLLALILELHRVTLRWRETSIRDTLPTAILVASTLYVYGLAGLAWPVAICATLAAVNVAATIATTKRVREVVTNVRTVAVHLAKPSLFALATVLLLALADIGRLADFAPGVAAVKGGAGIATAEVGNLFGQIPGPEVLGVWLAADYRYGPSAFRFGLFSGVAFVVVLIAMLWWLRRRSFTMLAAVTAFLLIYVYSRTRQSPYVTAKALAIAAPTVMALIVTPLLHNIHLRRGSIDPLPLVLTAFFVPLALASSGMALLGSQVGTSAQTGDLEKFRTGLAADQTLFLGIDDFANYRLRGRPVTSPIYPIPRTPTVVRAGKLIGHPVPFDFDSLDDVSLDRFRYAVLPLTSFASRPQPNWRLIRRGDTFGVWERGGATPFHAVLPGERFFPGARLDCSRRAERRVAIRAREAAIIDPPPVVGFQTAWRNQAKTQVAPLADDIAFFQVGAGETLSQRLPLEPGRWRISIQYAGSLWLRVSGPGFSVVLDPHEGHRGPFYEIATVNQRRVGVPTISVTAFTRSWLPRSINKYQFVELSKIAAVREGSSTILHSPGSRLCGKYVDWYRE